MSKLFKFILISYLLLISVMIINKNYHMFSYENNIYPDTLTNLVGDVNGDGKVSSLDYLLVRKHILKIANLDNRQIEKADMNKDGKIGSIDYILIKKAIINKTNTSEIKDDNKVLTATFINQDSNNITISKNSISCDTNGTSCNITLPNITAKDGYEVIGWSKNKNDTSSSLKSGSKVSITNNETYYTITKNKKPIKASFIVQNNMANTSNETSVCYPYNGAKGCEITSPLLNTNKPNTTIIGWNTDKASSKSILNIGEKKYIEKDTTFYSITSTLVNITYNVGENISNVNTKASLLSFTNNSHTTCTSYNGNGCSIKWIPTIISPGNVVHGFSKTTSGNVINVAKTIFTEDTTLYARIYNDVDSGNKIKNINVKKYEIVGNVLVEVENGITDTVANTFIKYVKDIYNDFPELLMWNGTITLYTYKSYTSMFGTDSGGITNHGGTFSKDFSHVSVFYLKEANRNNVDYYLGNCIHEITHAYNYGLYWNGGISSAISKTSDITDLYNKYKNSSSRPINNYAYNSVSEFYSEAVRVYYYRYLNSKYNKKLFAADYNGWALDINNAVEKYNKVGLDYYKCIGRI